MADSTPHLDQQLSALHARMDAILAQQHQRFLGLASGVEGGSLFVQDQAEGFYGGEDGMRPDRLETAAAAHLAQLHERLNALEHSQRDEQQHGHQGMGL